MAKSDRKLGAASQSQPGTQRTRRKGEETVVRPLPNRLLQKEALQVGALPWRVRGEHLEFLLVTSRASGHWLIPKGWPMNGKSNRDAALQEAFEEAGIRGRGTPLPIGQYRFLKALHDGSELPCVMSVFGMTRVVELDAWPEMDQRERRWFSQAEAIEVIFDWSLARFVAEVRLDALEEAARLADK